MDPAREIFGKFKARQRSYEATLALYGVLTLRSQVSDRVNGPVILDYEDQFKEYAQFLRKMQIALPEVDSGRYRIEPRQDGDFDLMIPKGGSGLEGLGAAPFAWLIIIAGVIVAWKSFEALGQHLRIRAAEEDRVYQGWFASLPEDVRKEVASQSEHISANTASQSVWADIAGAGKGVLSAGIGIAIALAGVLLFQKLYGKHETVERE